MKRFIPTMIVVLLCVAAFWYADKQHFFKAKTPPKNLIKVSQSDITSFTVHDPKVKSDLVFTKSSASSKNWTLSGQPGLPIDSSSIDAWLGTISSLNYDNIVEKNPQDISQFGLKNPAEEYQIKLAGGKTDLLKVGDALPVSGYHYAQIDRDSTIYKVADTSLNKLNQDELNFVNKSVFDFTYPQFVSMQWSWKGGSWSLQKADAAKSVYDTPYKLNKTKILQNSDGSDLIDKFMFLETKSMPLPASQVNGSKPDFTLDMTEKGTGKNAQEQTVQYTGTVDKKGNVWVVKKGGKYAFSVASTDIGNIATAFNNALKSPEPSPSPAASPVHSGTPAATK